MHSDILLLAERLVTAVEGMHEDVRNISTYMCDLSRSVSNILNEKRGKGSNSPVSCVEADSLPSGAPAARQEARRRSQYSWEHEQRDMSAVAYCDVVDQEEISNEDAALADTHHNENVDVLTSVTGGVKVEKQSEGEENGDTFRMDNTSENGRDNTGDIVEEIKDGVHGHAVWLPVKEERDDCVPIGSPEHEVSFLEMNQQPHLASSETSCAVQVASSPFESLSVEGMGMNPQDNFWKKLCSSECGTGLVQNLQPREPLAIASCSTAEYGTDQEEVSNRYLSYEQGNENVSGVRHSKHVDESGREMAPFSEVPMQESALLRNPSEGSKRDGRRRTFECSMCKKQFFWKSLFLKHIQAHTGEGSFKCSWCEKAFLRNGDLIRHMRIHTGERPYKCNLCGKAFNQSFSLTLHMRTHTGEKPFGCKLCGKQFNSNSDLTSHMHKHTGEKPYKCNQCGKAFHQSVNLSVHMRIHKTEKPFSCSRCNKAFLRNGDLMRHMRTHTGERPYKCSVCDKAFIQSGSLTKHMYVHTGIKPFRCDQCEREFSSNSALASHMLTHMDEKPYKCSLCGKEFHQSLNLSLHMRTHTTERHFKCSRCKKAFLRNGDLMRHMRIHTGERPHKCSLCEKSFVQKFKLTLHMRVHTGEKPYECDLCGKQFSCKSSLNVHRQSHIQ